MLAMRPARESVVGSTANAKIIREVFGLMRQQLCRLWSGMGRPLQGGEEQAHNVQVSIRVDYTTVHHEPWHPHEDGAIQIGILVGNRNFCGAAMHICAAAT